MTLTARFFWLGVGSQAFLNLISLSLNVLYRLACIAAVVVANALPSMDLDNRLSLLEQKVSASAIWFYPCDSG